MLSRSLATAQLLQTYVREPAETITLSNGVTGTQQLVCFAAICPFRIESTLLLVDLTLSLLYRAACEINESFPALTL